jgi:NitT/TauT family transport system substrate-binding protein
MRNRVIQAVLLATGVLFSAVAWAQAKAPINVKVGIIPIVNVATIFLAQEKGFFKEEGLNVETRMFQGGAEISAAAIGGDIDVGFSNVATQIIAQVQGAPIRLVAPNDISSSKAVIDEVFVKADSKIASLKDLTGKRVAINALRNVPDLVLRAAIDAAGGDSTKVVMVEVPYPQMGSVLAAGQVDAAYPSEPFKIIVAQSGAKLIGNPRTIIEGAPYGVWMGSLQKIKANKDLYDRFGRAIAKANRFAVANPDEMRRLAPTFTRLTPDMAAKMALPMWSPTFDTAALQKVADLMVKYGFIKQPIQASETIAR